MTQSTTTVTPCAKTVEELRVAQINFYGHEIYAGDKLIAAINHDSEDFVTQRWVVMVNGVEIFRDSTFDRCHSYIQWHYKQGTLPVQEAVGTTTTTANEVMAQIFTECDLHGFEILDDGIYRDDQKLGSIDYTDGRWWALLAEHQQKVPYDSVMDAVRSLVDVSSCEDLLNKPFDELSSEEWSRLVEYQPASGSLELLAA